MIYKYCLVSFLYFKSEKCGIKALMMGVSFTNYDCFDQITCFTSYISHIISTCWLFNFRSVLSFNSFALFRTSWINSPMFHFLFLHGSHWSIKKMGTNHKIFHQESRVAKTCLQTKYFNCIQWFQEACELFECWRDQGRRQCWSSLIRIYSLWQCWTWFWLPQWTWTPERTTQGSTSTQRKDALMWLQSNMSWCIPLVSGKVLKKL